MRGKFLAIALAVVMFGFVPAAQAQEWGGITWNVIGEGAGSFDLDEFGTLHFVNDGSEGGFAAGISLDPVDFDGDFAYGIRYHLDTGFSDSVGLGLGLVDSSYNSVMAELSALDTNRGFGVYDDILGTSPVVQSPAGSFSVPSDGWMGMMFDKQQDTLRFGVVSLDHEILMGAEIAGFSQAYFGDDPDEEAEDLNFFLAVWADGEDVVLPGQATFAGLTSGPATVSPEPLSATLFVLGAGALAARRFRKK